VLATTGATGALGGRVAAGLAERGVEQRLLARDPSRAPDLAGAEVRAIGGYGDAEGMRAALEGVDTLFLVSAGEARDRVALHRSAVEAAVAAGVGRVVYVSFVGAAPDATFTFARDHWHTEELIRASGLRWAFQRSNMYLEMLPLFAGADGVIRGPAGDGRFRGVARDDVAAVGVSLLTGAGEDGRTYDVCGPEALTLAEAAARIGEAAGRPVVYQPETLEQARASRASTGAEAWEIEGWITSYAAIATGELDVASDAVRELTGRAPRDLGEVLSAHPELLARLREG
jgi:uncharacterized protein YbjT (DUF2867 family)